MEDYNIKIQRFLRELNNIIGLICEQKFQQADVAAEGLSEIYDSLDTDEKLMILDCVRQLTGNEYSTTLYIFSILYEKLCDNIVTDYLIRILDEEDIDPLTCINALYQMDAFKFSNGWQESVEVFKTKRRIYRKQVKKVRKQLEDKLTYIPEKSRNHKNIVITVRTLLSERHAPTKVLINLTKYLEGAGYDVYVIINHMTKMQIAKANDWYKCIYDNNLSDVTQKFVVNASEISIKGYNFELSEVNFWNELETAIDIVRDINPEFIIDIGGENIVSDVCTKATTVCCLPCVARPVISDAGIFIRASKNDDKADQKYRSYMEKDDVVFDMLFSYVAADGDEEKVDKAEFGIDKNAFLILVVGNRLDCEITDEFIDIMTMICEKSDRIHFAIIGKCEQLEKKISLNKYADRYTFIGYVNNFKGTMAMGDIFLNPPRQGGGTGAMFAIQNRVPIITLPDCDVALRGSRFTCDNIEDFPELVEKYINDAEFMESQKKYCDELNIKSASIDSFGNVKKGCQNIENYICNMEEKMHEINTI